MRSQSPSQVDADSGLEHLDLDAAMSATVLGAASVPAEVDSAGKVPSAEQALPNLMRAEPGPPAPRPETAKPPSNKPALAVHLPPPLARAGAVAVPTSVAIAGIAGGGHLLWFAGSWPIAALVAALGMVGALFCRVLLRG